MGEIIVIDRPDSVSWEELSAVLKKAHEQNLQRGIKLPYPFLPPAQLQEKTEGRGARVLVALCDGQVVGIGAVATIQKNVWCHRGDYAYSFLDAVLPAFSGKGVFRRIEAQQEAIAREWGLQHMLFDTDERNRRMIRVTEKMGFRKVDYRVRPDHRSVILVKWLDGCPHTRLWCSIKYLHKKWKRKQDKREAS